MYSFLEILYIFRFICIQKYWYGLQAACNYKCKQLKKTPVKPYSEHTSGKENDIGLPRNHLHSAVYVGFKTR